MDADSRPRADLPGAVPPPLPAARFHRHAAVRARLVDALRARRAATDAAAATAETRAASLLDDLYADLDDLLSEGFRRGLGISDLHAAWEEATGLPGGIDTAVVFREAFPEGVNDAALVPWRRASEAGRVDAMYVFAELVLAMGADERTGPEALRFLAAAADAGRPGACIEFARLLAAEGGPLRRDPDLAERYLRRAAESGNPRALRLAAQDRVAPAVPARDRAAALADLERAAAAGDAEAALLAGAVHAGVVDGREPDHAAAVRHLRAAAAADRWAAREWMERYGALDAREFRNRTWYEAWTPTELPRPEPASRLGLGLSIGFLVLLGIGMSRGDSLGWFLILGFGAVLLHECGHFVAALRTGIPILVFSVGVGPLVRALTIRRGRLPTRVEFRILPLLGFVRPYTVPRDVFERWRVEEACARDGTPPGPLPDFDRAAEPLSAAEHLPPVRRVPMLAAGLAVNLLAAVACFWIHERASPAARSVVAPVVGRVLPGSVAEGAGLREGDRILAVGGRPVVSFREVERRLAPLDLDGRAVPPPDPPGVPVSVEVERDGTRRTLSWEVPRTPPAHAPRDAYGLFPATGWVIAHVAEGSQNAVGRGERLTAFAAGGRRVEVDEPGAAALFREAFSSPDAEVPVFVWRGAGEVGVTLRSRGNAARAMAPEPPITFEPLRETRPPAGVVDVLRQVGRLGVRILVDLPGDVLGAVGRSRTEEERTVLTAAAARDASEWIRAFGFIHALLLFLNLLPVPPLDGFQIACAGWEAATRRPLPRAVRSRLLIGGWVVLGAWLALNAFLVLRDAITGVL